MAPKLTIQILGWNSAKELPALFGSIESIPESEAVIRYIDNASADDSVRVVESLCPRADIIRLPENIGYAGGHNAGFRKCTTEFVLVVNPDVEIYWEGIKEVLRAFDDVKVGAAQGLLMRGCDVAGRQAGQAHSSGANSSLPSGGKEEWISAVASADGRLSRPAASQHQSSKGIIDSAGIVLSYALNGKERGAGEVEAGQYNEPADLIAVTGACGVYRMEALKAVAHKRNGESEFFDEDFFAYKEDVDLGWRLNRAGWKVKYVPVAAGVHARHLRGEGFMNWGLNPVRIYKRLASKRTRYSLRNWIWMIIKNATVKQMLLHKIFIGARALVLFALSFLYPPLLTVWPEIIGGLPKVLNKRQDGGAQYCIGCGAGQK